VQGVAGSNPAVPTKIIIIANHCRPECSEGRQIGTMDKKLLDILACPLCKTKLIYEPHQQELICKADKLAFPIHDGIPVMLEESARKLTDKETINGI
jgi:uncharacterized protein YbaR (Trm112 family)